MRRLAVLSLFFCLTLIACTESSTVPESAAPETIVTQATFGGYNVNVVAQQRWRGGFKGAVVLANRNGQAVESFEVKFKLNNNNPISNGWNGSFSSPDARGFVTLKSPGHLKNNKVRAGSRYESGFVANRAFSGATVASLKVNGKTVGGGTPAPQPKPQPKPQPNPQPTPQPNPQPRPDPTLKPLPELRLFHPTRGTVAHVENDIYFNANGRTHTFNLPKGTKNNRERVHARIEAFQFSGRFRAGQGSHGFSANYNVSNLLPGNINVMQLFSRKDTLPQIRIELRPNGQMRAAFGDGKPVVMAERGDYNLSNFDIRVVSDGRVADVYLDGKQKVNNRVLRFKNVENYFRWGIYYGEVMPRTTKVVVRNLRIW